MKTRTSKPIPVKTRALYILLALVTWGTASHAQQHVFIADIGFAGTLSESDVMRADSLLLETPYEVTFMPGLQHLTLTHPQPFVPEDVVQALRDLGLFAGLIKTNFRTSKAGTSNARNVGMDGAKRAYAIAHPEAYSSQLKTREEQLRAAADTSAFYRHVLERHDKK